MNVKRTSSLQGLFELERSAVASNALMTATETGFLIRRVNTSNSDLRAVLLSNTKRDDVRFLVRQAWGCGDDMAGGLHIADV